MSAGIRSGVNQTRHALEQHVATGEERREHAFDDVVLTDHHAPDLGAD